MRKMHRTQIALPSGAPERRQIRDDPPPEFTPVRNGESTAFSRLLQAAISCLTVERCRQCRSEITISPAGGRELEWVLHRPCHHPSTLCLNCWQELISPSPEVHWLQLGDSARLPVVGALPYEGTVRHLLQKLKYDDDTLVARDLACALARCLPIVLRLIEAVGPAGNVLLVPIPLSLWKLWKRGFNQVELLVKAMHTDSKRLVPSTRALSRVKNTRAHYQLTREQRIENLNGAFTARSSLVAGKPVIIVDDIFTSGATLAEAARALIGAGAGPIGAVVLSRAELNFRDNAQSKDINRQEGNERAAGGSPAMPATSEFGVDGNHRGSVIYESG